MMVIANCSSLQVSHIIAAIDLQDEMMNLEERVPMEAKPGLKSSYTLQPIGNEDNECFLILRTGIPRKKRRHSPLIALSNGLLIRSGA